MHILKRLTCLLLCAALLLSLCGCRYSSVLEQIIYDMRRGQDVDTEADFHPEENDPENEDTSDDLKDVTTDEDALRTTDETPELPITEDTPETPSEQPEVEESSANLEYAAEDEINDSAPADGNTTVQEAPTVMETAEPEPSASEPVAEPEPIPVETASTEPEPVETDAAAAAAESEETAAESADSGDLGSGEGVLYEPSAVAQTWKQVVDVYGTPVNIPENVDTVAAVGELAIMILILSGPDRLAATNADLNSGLAATVYPALADVPALWSGSGQTSLSDSAFAELLEIAPDVVIEASGSTTMTDSQIAQLAEYEIAYLVVPAPTSPTNVSIIMTTLGTVLGDRSADGGANAPQQAAEYTAWVNDLTQTVSQATAAYAAYSDSDTGESVAGTYTLYVDAWDDDAYYRLYSDNYVTLSGYGCAVIRNGATTSCRTLSSYLGLANVVNTAAQYGITPKAQYFTPLISAYRTMEVTGNLADGQITDGQKLLEQSDGSLGTENFSILLAADKHTAEAIAASKAEENGLWTVYPHINSGDGSFNSDGFLDEEGNLVRTQISGDYEIVVNPSGLSSWVGGSAESILESAWAAWRFFGAISEEQLRAYISDFYSLFYSYSLSDTQIDAILGGQ